MNILSRCGSQFEVLQGLEPTVGALMARHKARPDMWFPSDLLPVNDCDDAREDDLRLLRRRARTLPDAVRVVLDMNIRTEEGLPHFHRLIAGVAKPGSNIGRWNYLWTAEEDRHGCVLRDYLRDASILDMRAVEVRQFEYLCAGFDPAWAGGSPYEIFVYTTLQEKATQLSHQQTGKVAGDYEPTLAGILRKVAEDEAWHYAFYLALIKAVLAVDPDGALVAAARILPHIDMPGLAMPDFRNYAEVAARLGVYTLRNYKDVVEKVIEVWGVGTLTHLGPAGGEAQGTILTLPARLETLARRTESRMKKKSFSFDVVRGRSFDL